MLCLAPASRRMPEICGIRSGGCTPAVVPARSDGWGGPKCNSAKATQPRFATASVRILATSVYGTRHAARLRWQLLGLPMRAKPAVGLYRAPRVVFGPVPAEAAMMPRPTPSSSSWPAPAARADERARPCMPRLPGFVASSRARMFGRDTSPEYIPKPRNVEARRLRGRFGRL